MSMPVGAAVGQTCTHATVAIDTGSRVRRAGLATRLAPPGVVADDHRVVVGERRLQAAVGADDDAELLAEPGEIEIEHAAAMKTKRKAAQCSPGADCMKAHSSGRLTKYARNRWVMASETRI
jgi:hypothetical protein